MTSGQQIERHPSFDEEGSYRLAIVKISFITIRVSQKQKYLIEVDITESNNPLHPVGQRMSCWIDWSNPDMRGKNLSAFIAAIYNFAPSELPKDTPVAPWVEPATGQQMGWDYYALASIDDAQPWAGAPIGLKVSPNNKGFPVHYWHVAANFLITPLPVSVPAQEVGPPAGGWTQYPAQQAPAAAPAAQQPAWQQPPQAAPHPQQQVAPQAAPQQQVAHPQHPPQPVAHPQQPQQQVAPQPAAAPQAAPPQPQPAPGFPPQGGWGTGQPPQ